MKQLAKIPLDLRALLYWQRAGTSFSSPGSHAGLMKNLVDQGRGLGVVITTRSIRASRSLGLASRAVTL